MDAAAYLVDDLSDDSCWQLLATATIGRISSTERGLPKILPVHFTVHDGEVVIGRLPGADFLRVEDGDVVALETDAYDAARREGWYVGLVGSCRAITSGDEIAELDGLGFTPRTSADGARYVAIEVGRIYGRAVTCGATESLA
jgi:uncharacterized protein